MLEGYKDNPLLYEAWKKVKLKAGEFARRQPIENPPKLEVHHTYYIWHCLPWDYDLDALTTLCHVCHCEYHRSNQPLAYTDKRRKWIKKLIECDRCGGSGFLECYDYIQGGVCFKCWGTGGFDIAEASAQL